VSIKYYISSDVGDLLEDVSKKLNIGDEVELKIKTNKPINFYYGYLIYHGFGIKNMMEKNKEIVVNIIKNKNINSIKDKNYSWLIKLPRTGKNGKKIFVYKLRTMEPYSEYMQDFVIEKNGFNKNGTIKDDFRITKLGKFLRKYWIDELPMLFNFLKGEVKIVGVRPLSDSMLKKYPKEFVSIRNNLKPGLIPPCYIEKPNSFDELIDSEKRYIEKYNKNGSITDIIYFYKFINNIIFNGVRSS